MSTTEIIVVELEKQAGSGLGLNVVGGTDHRHIPGDNSIFVSKLKAGGIAERDGRLKPGDRILRVNDEALQNMKHEEAVNVFRNAKGTVRLLVEKNAEQFIIQNPTAKSVALDDDRVNDLQHNGTVMASGGGSYDLSSARSTGSVKTATAANSKLRNGPFETCVDTPQSGMSTAPSSTSLVDDVPKTPKKSPSKENLHVTSPYVHEMLYTVVGVAAVAAIAFFVYRRYVNK